MIAAGWTSRNASSTAPSWLPKKGAKVGPTKRGKGTKIMAMADAAGLPLGIHVEAASPHEVILVEPTLAACVIDTPPKRLIGDKAYDSCTSPEDAGSSPFCVNHPEVQSAMPLDMRHLPLG